ncbi:MAG: M48 family metalloprotease [Candidatus Puniceispirillales bacterium]
MREKLTIISIFPPSLFGTNFGANFGLVTWRQLCLGLLMNIALIIPANANMIRDTEIEHFLLSLARPMAQSAGLEASQLKIRVIIDPRFNAFVTGEHTIFVHSGMIIDAENVYEVAGVLAHEIGHLASGHVPSRGEVIDQAMMTAMFGAVAAIALSASGHGDAAIGTVIGSNDQATRKILKQSRQDESEADQWAIKLMDEHGYPILPMANLMAKMAKQRLLPTSRQSDYYQTHPGAAERSSVFLDHAKTQSDTHSDHDHSLSHTSPDSLIQQFEQVRAKMRGWTDAPSQSLLQAKNHDPDSQYLRAIALYRLSDLEGALSLMDTLIAHDPDNPFYYEFRGEILVSSGRPDQAIAAFETGLDRLDSHINKGQILLSLGRSLMHTGDPDNLDKAIPLLEEANRLEPDWAFVKHQLGITYGRAGRVTDADLILSERALMLGNHSLAKQLALRAKNNPDATDIQKQLALDIIALTDQ